MNQRILTLKRKYIGDRAFYRMTLAVAVPIMVQNGITNFVSLLDNIMVGSTGKIPMSGVSIVNQLLFVYSLCIFGALSGAGIFTAQYYGQDDTQGIRHTFRYKLWLGVILTAGAVALFAFRGDRLISLYLDSEENTPAVVAETLGYGLKYLRIMLLGLPPFMLVQTYTSTLRETSETLLPMRAGIAAVLTNLVFNALLIYGLLGFPALGVEGAAMATVISRYVEAAIVLTWTHSSPDRCPWAVRIYRTLRVPAAKARQFFVRGFPLLANEALWSTGITFLNQCYSVRGVDVVASMNISSTVSNLFMIIFTTLGSAVAIIVGQLLGRGSMDEARDTDRKLIAFSVMCALGTGLVMFLLSPLFPLLYNVEPDVRGTAAVLIRISACAMPIHAFLNAAYFTLRSGGKTWITFLFDCGFVWAVSIPVAFVLSRFTGLNAVWMYVIVSAADLIKCAAGYIMVRSGSWVNNIVSGQG